MTLQRLRRLHHQPPMTLHGLRLHLQHRTTLHGLRLLPHQRPTTLHGLQRLHLRHRTTPHKRCSKPQPLTPTRRSRQLRPQFRTPLPPPLSLLPPLPRQLRCRKLRSQRRARSPSLRRCRQCQSSLLSRGAAARASSAGGAKARRNKLRVYSLGVESLRFLEAHTTGTVLL